MVHHNAPPCNVFFLSSEKVTVMENSSQDGSKETIMGSGLVVGVVNNKDGGNHPHLPAPVLLEP